MKSYCCDPGESGLHEVDLQSYHIISRHGLNDLVLKMLREGQDVRGPIAEGKGFVFAKITDAAQIQFDYARADSSPLSDYLMPREETLLSYVKTADGQLVFSEPASPTACPIFIGVHPYDIRAMQFTDARFLGQEFEEPYYAKRRARMVVIGLDVSVPPPHSFAASMGAHTVKSGYDLMLTLISDNEYLVEVGTDVGGKILKKYATTYPGTEADVRVREEVRSRVAAAYTSYMPSAVEDLPDLLKRNSASPFYDDAAKMCLRCNRCIDICPTCTCFDVKEMPALDGQRGCEVREKTSCLLCAFWRRAGDVYGLATPAERFANRIWDKLAYGQEKEGRQACTGCGRCIGACPVQTGMTTLADPTEAVREIRAHGKTI